DNVVARFNDQFNLSVGQGPVSLAPGASFSGTLGLVENVGGTGTHTFLGYATGNDRTSGGSISSNVVNSTATFLSPTFLSTNLVVAPTPAETGQWIQALLTVGNEGDVAANGVTVALQKNLGGSLLVFKTQPSPTA